MRIIDIEIENFRSFRDGPHALQMGDLPPGLHFVTGENRVDIELGANGAGKSTVFDAVNYALFGKTLQGLTGGAVVSWGAQSCAVAIRVAIGAREVEIQRGRNGRTNYLRMDGEEAAQDAVDRALGLTESMFAQALVRKQFAVMFFDRSPADQLKMLTEVLGLEFWDGKSDAAKGQAKSIADIERKTEDAIGRNEGKREAAAQSASEAKALVDAADHQHKINVAAAAEATADRDSFLTAMRKNHESAVRTHAELSDAFNKSDADIESVKLSYQNAVDIARQYRTQADALNEAKAQWLKRIRHFESLSGSCPTCEQAVGAEHINACISVARVEIAKGDELLARINVDVEKADSAAADFNTMIVEYNNARKLREDKILEAAKAVTDALRVVNTAEREAAAAHQHANMLTAWKNPHTKTLDVETKKSEALAAQIKSDKESLASIQRDKSNAEFWVDGFRRIRLFVIDRAITTLEVEVNASLASLGLTGYRIHFATERVTKAGGVSRKFDVMVDCPAARKESVPLAAWSGGEYQRLRLACELGVSNMILKARGINSEFEVWDEPTTHLSAQGVESLMHSLRERAYALKRQVWLIDHVAHPFAFDSVTRVVKTAEGSRFIA